MRSVAEEGVAKGCKKRTMEEHVEKKHENGGKNEWQAWKNQGKSRKPLGK